MVAENDLRQLFGLAIPPELQDIFDTSVDLRSRFVRQQRVDQPLIQPQLASIAGDFEHIIFVGVNRTAMHLGGPFGQLLSRKFMDNKNNRKTITINIM